ncbi:response regulator [Salipiger bermudensis]|uniref:response regulator n=1 Tax=Salipiger bermudensis TaxID=344736 RepID=UPI001C99E0EA|nr:response regulator [Salipiger bermudensis]MBY6006129.1 response regulator [Salipiger bermudensis]
MPKILYVDDENDIREIAEMALELEESFEVRTAASGQAGLELARSFQPDLMMLDVMMPGMDGISTFGAARNDPALADIPIVFVTARTQTHQVAELMELGALGVIPKPFDPLTLAEDIEAFLA